AGYSASVGSLGYGDVSFVDAVTSEHLVENLVDAAGMEIEEGSIEMPAVEDYRTYADDGKTIAQELYTFGGEASGSDGSSYAWSCKLSYDYSAANVSGNLADTIRQVYVYVKAAS
ncbi:MAG: histone-lysine N-methyltransferase, partial [Slackia sp.]